MRDQVGTCPCERPGKVDGEHPDAEHLSRVGAAGVINRNNTPLKQSYLCCDLFCREEEDGRKGGTIFGEGKYPFCTGEE